MSTHLRIAIIGGGFSGTMVLVNLARIAPTGTHIDLFETNEALAEGVAYGTKSSVHLLNVRANNMGAFAGKPAGFVEWLESAPGKASLAELWPGHIADAKTFVPRVVYSAYLKHLLKQAIADAPAKKLDIQIHHDTVTDAALHGQGFTIATKSGHAFEADKLVLATGNLPPKQVLPGQNASSKYYIDNAWLALKDPAFCSKLAQLPESSHLVIIGTGLTMVDAVLTLEHYGYKGRITAISRHGWLPTKHAEYAPYPAWSWVNNPETAPTSALGLLSGMRREIRKAAKAGHDWRAVIDSLRPVTQQIWERLSLKEKSKFLRRLGTHWSIHRHRMAPEIHEALASLQQSGRLNLIAAKLIGSQVSGDQLEISYRSHGAAEQQIRAQYVLSCTGPQYDITRAEHALLANLREQGLIIPGELRAGIELTSQNSAKGVAANAVFPIGPLMAGEILESTAVPDLRNIADAVARRLLNH